MVKNSLLDQVNKPSDIRNFANISSKKYVLSRPLYVYFKKENLVVVPRIGEFIKELIGKETLGSKGYLINSGLVPLSDKEVLSLQKNILPLVD